ncbi:MAG: flagellar hook-basal body complex protein FliE [Candidatus Accumulibacter sp.]|jgi:flagellar hook-basal body complex protein FliE|nr:flagellar hook-basal body complex protein FliE [Accumulibacter sp.]
MDTKGIDQMLSVLRATAAQAAGEPRPVEASGADFAQVLKNAIEQVNQTQQQAEDMAAKFAAGDGDTALHDVMISLQKANVSFQEMVQVRNRLVTAYHDVMNMQV